MFSNWSLGRKIGAGFGVVLTLLCLVVVWSLFGISGIVGNANEVIGGNQLKAFIVEKEVDHLNWANKVSDLINNEEVTDLAVQTDSHKCSFGQWYYSEERQKAEEMVPGLKDILVQIEMPHKDLHESAHHIKEEFQQADIALGGFLRESKNAHLNWMTKVQAAMLEDKTELTVQKNPKRCSFGKWLYSDDIAQVKAEDSQFAATWNKIEIDHNKLHASADGIEQHLGSYDVYSAQEVFKSETYPSAQAVLAGIDEFIAANDEDVEGMQKAARIYSETTIPNLHTVKNLLNDAAQEVGANVMTDHEMLQAAQRTKTAVSILGGIAVILGIGLGILITRSIVRALTQVMENLGVGSEQVSVASSKVATSSQEMADGASNQASSLEETSATLEEMAAMTKQNASYATEANQLSSNLQGVAQGGQESMERMTGAIEKIKDSADQTARIIKTIDEIAFQTNLLALNAAVEAARAGDAGKGFAVVAEEVRNLAQRSAEAAQDTAELIDQSQVNANGGVEVTNEVTTILEEVVGGISRVSELIDMVTKASEEQSRGVDEINTAVAQLDNVTQSNAANAEESASASEELSGQARDLKEMVQTLSAIINGAQYHATGQVSVSPRVTKAAKAATTAGDLSAAPGHWYDTKVVNVPTTGKASIPEGVIPLEENDMIEL